MYGLSEQSDVRKVKTKCRGCGATITIAVMEGECTTDIIVGCDKCNKLVKHKEEEE